MQLLCPEIDIVPGRSGAYPSQAIYEGQSIPGSTVVQLTNTTSQENAFTLSLECEHPYWQQDWYTLSVLPPPAREEGASVKPAQLGPRGRWIKVYVPRGGVRNVLVRFHVPRNPVSRAGKYAFTVKIERQIADKPENGLRTDHQTHLAGVATILPYYEWSIDIAPAHPGFHIYQRSLPLEVVVNNESNDWLYCELQLPQPKDLVLETPTRRIAAPPPEPGQILEGENTLTPRVCAQRRIPLYATTRLTPVFGAPIAQPLLIGATRVDAPTTGQSSELTDMGFSGLSVAKLTDELVTPQIPRVALCHPLVHQRITRIYGDGTSLIRGLVTTLLTVLTVALGLIMGYEYVRYRNISIEPEQAEVVPGAELKVRGESLDGARITLNNTRVALVPVKTEHGVYVIIVPEELAGAKAKLKAQRQIDFLPPALNGLLPLYEAHQEVHVMPLQAPPPGPQAAVANSPAPGASSGAARVQPQPAQKLSVAPLPFIAGPPPLPSDAAMPGAGAAQPDVARTTPGGAGTGLPGYTGGTGAVSGNLPGSGAKATGGNNPGGAAGGPPVPTAPGGAGVAPTTPGGNAAGAAPAPAPDYSATMVAPFQQLQHETAQQVRNQASDLINRATAVLKLNPDSPGARAMRGILLVQTGHLDESKRDLDTVLSQDTQNAQARVGLARYWTARATGKGIGAGRVRQLLAYGELNARMALTLDPSSAQAKYALAAILYRSGRYAAAEALCTELLPKDPNPTDPGLAPFYLLRGQSLAAHDELRAASLDLLAAKRLDPTLPGLKEALAAINE